MFCLKKKLLFGQDNSYLVQILLVKSVIDFMFSAPVAIIFVIIMVIFPGKLDNDSKVTTPYFMRKWNLKGVKNLPKKLALKPTAFKSNILSHLFEFSSNNWWGSKWNAHQCYGFQTVFVWYQLSKFINIYLLWLNIVAGITTCYGIFVYFFMKELKKQQWSFFGGSVDPWWTPNILSHIIKIVYHHFVAIRKIWLKKKETLIEW